MISFITFFAPIAYSATVVGILAYIFSYFLSFVPSLVPYKILVRVLSASLVLFGAWANGVLYEEKKFNQKIAEQTVKISQLEAASAKVNTKIQYVFVDKIQKVKDVQVVVQEKIRDVAVNIDKDCKITSDTVNILNTSAKGVTK